MPNKQLRSIEHLSDSGEVEAACGHKVDVRQIVYVHYPKKTVTSCLKCAEKLPDWKGKA